jgi:Uri superfamily endonuclease
MPIIANQPPREPGSYLLILTLPKPTQIQVGRLGRIRFGPGWYVYAGSAFGPGGLAARLRHHLKPVQKRHWHIDYLRAEAMVVEIWMTVGPPSREHDWAALLAKGPRAGKRVRGFGCSDCNCSSHLLHFDHRPGEDLISTKLGAGITCWQLTRDPALP